VGEISFLETRTRGALRESLLVVSDVHLGSDLNELQTDVVRRSSRVDADLVRMIEHYRHARPEGDRWRLVVAGDFIDFIGITVKPKGGEIATELIPEEIEHGLGNTSDHARAKLRRVAERHPDVFAALARFVADGHAMTIVHGNHDVEFHWDEVKDELRDLLAESANAPDPSFSQRIEYAPWFFYQGGVYIEHGHQYDALCSNEHVMAPLSPLDPRRIARGFCDVLLRFVVRPTRGLKEHGHERMGVFDYLRFGARLGLRGLANLGLNFGRAIVELLRVRRAMVSEKAKALREEHERKMAHFAEMTRVSVEKLRAIAALHAKPVTLSISGIFGTVLLDRMLLAVSSALALTGCASLGTRHPAFWAVAPVIGVAWFLVHRHLAKKRKLDPDDLLVERAGHLAKLFPAAFVVMGHTHTPVQKPVEGGATYINVGSWAEEEESSYRAARTHLVIHPDASGPVARFLAWDPQEGPRHWGEGSSGERLVGEPPKPEGQEAA
jgi:UDP-2,3-diacylglucosamine pyrophosphatase LpxH